MTHLHAQIAMVFKCTPQVIMSHRVRRCSSLCLFKVPIFVSCIFKKAWPFPHSWTCTRCWPLVRKLCMLAEDVLVLSPWEGHAWKHFRFYTSHLNTRCCNTTWDRNTTPTNSQESGRTGGKRFTIAVRHVLLFQQVGKKTSAVKGHSEVSV